jgi:hypothetical protein
MLKLVLCCDYPESVMVVVIVMLITTTVMSIYNYNDTHGLVIESKPSFLDIVFQFLPWSHGRD